MMTRQTIKTSIKAVQRLEKRLAEHVEYNEQQVKETLKALERREMIVNVGSGGFFIKEEFNENTLVRTLNMHKEEVAKNKPLLEEYREALKELKSL